MSDIQAWLDEARTLADQATEGPWEAYEDSDVQYAGCPPTIENLVYAGAVETPIIDWGNGSTEADAAFIADARTRLPRALNALQAVLDLHVQGKFYGEPGDQECDHADDYDGPDHFWHEDYGMLCESTATYPPDPFCAGCHRDEENELQPWPCPTVLAITDAIEEQDA